MYGVTVRNTVKTHPNDQATIMLGFRVSKDVVYYESRKRELKRRLVNEGPCDERLKAKVE